MMKKFYSILTVISTLALTACKSGAQNEALHNEELDSAVVVTSEHPILDNLLTELDSSEIYNASIIYGYWFKPHEACAVNIIFHKDGRFEFKYYIVENDTTIIDVIKKGTYTVSDMDTSKTRIVYMKADEGWDEKVFKGTLQYKNNGTNFYLSDEESGLYLVKGSD